jgi:hypothetical protein
MSRWSRHRDWHHDTSDRDKVKARAATVHWTVTANKFKLAALDLDWDSEVAALQSVVCL